MTTRGAVREAAGTKYLDEPRAGRLNIQYGPADGAAVLENPPRFTWLPVVEEEARYVLRVSRDPAFASAETLLFTDLPLNFLTPAQSFEPGAYHWSYAVWNPAAKAPATNWSKVRTLVVGENLPRTPLAGRSERYASADLSHPRLWLNRTKLTAFRKAVAADPSHCAWSRFFENSVTPWIGRDIIAEPLPYPNDTRTAPVWRNTYIACQELIYAIRHLAIAGKVLDDDAMTGRAREWLLAVAAWDPYGTTSRAYTDEWAFRVTVALAWGYDWLHDVLSEDERERVRAALLARTREIADHVIRHANIHLFPFDSHAVRFVSAVLVPACIALFDDAPEARDWLDYAIEFLFTVYSPWGDADGGWAEGPHYWMTGMAYLTEAANLIRAFTGINLYERPFFQKTGDFPLYTKAPDTRRATFGDDSTMGDLPALKVGYNLRQYAGVTGNPAYQWYFEEVVRNDTGTEMEFYNYGWWDLNFDEMTYRHDWPLVQAAPPDPTDRLRWFKGIGWAAIQSRMDDPKKHIQFVMKSSPFGSVSHSHGDQNAFCLAGYGEDLAIQSGYYVAFNSSMHQSWRRQTRSKNAILINGKGQYAGKDKALAIQASGLITDAEERADHIYIRGDATAAYRSLSPEVTSAVREVYFVRDSFFVLVDSIDANEPVEVDWLLHANAPYDLGANSFRYTGTKAGFYGQFVWSEGGKPKLGQVTGFPDVDPADHDGLPVSTCLTARFPKAERHRIVTLLVPYALEDPKRIFHFVDDQGYDCDLYFNDADERSFKIVVQKLAKS